MFSTPFLSPISVSLVDEEIWRDFHQHNTEMIVTKPGRKIFPKLTLKVSGLDPQAAYCIKIIIARADNFKYKYQSDRWKHAGEEDEEQGKVGNLVFYRDGSIQSGKEWMKDEIDFNHVKLTNNLLMDEKHMVFVHSLHKYIPVVQIVPYINNFPQGPIHTEPLHLATFITVTAYQSPDIKRLKKSYNPYAKGQQNKEASARKRLATSPPHSSKAPPPPASQTPQTTPPFPSFPTIQPTYQPYYNYSPFQMNHLQMPVYSFPSSLSSPSTNSIPFQVPSTSFLPTPPSSSIPSTPHQQQSSLPLFPTPPDVTPPSHGQQNVQYDANLQYQMTPVAPGPSTAAPAFDPSAYSFHVHAQNDSDTSGNGYFPFK